MEGSTPPSSGLAPTLLDSLDVIVWVAEAESLRLLYVNRKGLARIGTSPEEWLSAQRPWTSLIHPDDRSDLAGLCAEVSRDAQPRDRVHRLIDANGQIRWFRTTISTTTRPETGVRALTGQMVEIALPPREPSAAGDGLLRLVRRLPIIIFTLNEHLRFTSGAGAGIEPLGLRPDQLAGVPLHELFGLRDEHAPELAIYRRALQGETVRGRERWGGRIFDLHLEPLRADGGHIQGVAGVAIDVTEQARSEDRYRQIVETAEEGIWVINAEAVTTFVNQKMAEMLGYSIPEMVGHSALELLDETMQPVAMANLQRRKQGIRERHEIRLRRRDGTDLWLMMSTSPIFDELGRFQGALGMGVDITERHRSQVEREQLLKDIDRRRQQLELVIEHAPLGIMLLRGKDFVVELANQAAHSMMPGKEMEGRRWYDDVSPELAFLRPQVEEAMRTGKPQQVVDARIPIRRRPGGPLEDTWMTSSRIPIELPDGSPGILLMFHDTTAMVRAREEIARLAAMSERQAAQLKTILDNMTDAVVAYDAAGNVSFANLACRKLLGLPEDRQAKPTDEQLRPLVESTSGASVDGTPAVVRALAGESLAEREFSFIQPGTGRRSVVRTSVVPLRGAAEETEGAILVSRDVTERAQFEQLKDEFIGVAAHELKTPVAIMKANAQLLLSGVAQLTPRQRGMADAIDRGADRIDRIVQELLDVSQLQMNALALRFASVDLRELARHAAGRISARAGGERIQIVAPEPLRVRGDPQRLEWVMLHLLNNALLYSPAGGPVMLRLESHGGEALLSVQDQGIGIPLDRQQQIFERFYRAHAGGPYDFGGLGVSLYISREIVRAHAGRMWFESEAGHGSTFHFALPLKESHDA